MIYFFPTLYKDKLSDTNFLFLYKGKDKYNGRAMWQPVVKVCPFIYRKIAQVFVDHKENFEKI